MTAIVGPNGCGKSNVSDAMRWVLGEQSAKALRGAAMADVIFNGTESEKPMNMAEVTITLTDCEEQLGVEYNEVAVTRRVHRSGEGQYFINKKACRLKDIQRLFMDTGIGTDAYSVLEQGRIDRILSSRPGDRRAVFEEAAGITKYKADRKEAQRKLEHTEANLLRIDDIISEVAKQINSLKRQAAKARRYQKLRRELRTRDLYDTRGTCECIAQQIEDLETAQQQLKQDECVQLQRIEAAENSIQEHRQAHGDLDSDFAEAHQSNAEVAAELERNRDLLKTNGERIRELTDFSKRDHRDAESARTAHADAIEQLESLTRNIEELTESLEQKKRVRDQAVGSHEQLNKERSNQQNKSRTLQNRLRSLDQEQARQRQTLQQHDEQQRKNNNERIRLQQDANSIMEQQERTSEQLQTVGTVFEETRRRDVQHKEQRESMEQDIALTRQTLSEQQKQLQAAERKKSALDAEIELLQRAVKETPPYPGGAQLLLSSGHDAILGPLAELIDCKAEYRRAVEVALRGQLDAIVARDPQSAGKLLATANNGSLRLIFPPAEKMQPPSAPVGTALAHFISAPPETKASVEQLLAHVLLIDDPEQIPEDSQCAFVTRDGRLYAPGHAEYWAPESEPENPLTRKHELQERLESQEVTEKECEQHVQQVEQIEAQLEQQTRQLKEQRTEEEANRRELGRHEGEKHALTQAAEKLHQRNRQVTAALEKLAPEDEADGKRQTLLDQEKILAREQDSLRQQQEQLASDLEDREKVYQQSESLLAEVRLDCSSTQHNLEQTTQSAAPLKRSIRQLEQSISNRDKDLFNYNEKIQHLELGMAQANKRLPDLEIKLQGGRDSLDQLNSTRTDLQEQINTQEIQLGHSRKELESIREKSANLDVRLTEERMRREERIQRCCRDYEIDAEEVLRAAKPDMEEQPADMQKHCDELRHKLANIGPVNLVAIEELEEHEERHTFLSEQHRDLIQAKNKLQQLIREINETTTRMFTETFEQVNAYFGETYTRIFGGGAARLELVEEEDVLEAGIEIIARPPGKKLQNISLLSGGERSMTALALLFALYQVKPSPFCFLDELDAALDDANIGRFVDLLRSFTEKSQFIVISHSRQTIAAADVLYGVSMEKRGVSKIISMKFHHQQ